MYYTFPIQRYKLDTLCSSHFHEQTQENCFVFIPNRYHNMFITLQCVLSQDLIVLCLTRSSRLRIALSELFYCWLFYQPSNCSYRQQLLKISYPNTYKCEQLTTRHKKVVIKTDDFKTAGYANNYEK